MMNVVALSLVVTSLAAAGVFSPTPDTQKREGSTIVKEGHRVVVVEYDEDGHHNTKISISPEADENSQDSTFIHAPRPRELICDAFGRCKHKIADAMVKAKERVSDVHEQAKEMGQKAKERVSDAQEQAKETGQTVKDHIAGNVSETRDSFRDAVSNLSSLMRVAHLLGFATGYGMCVWVTFISSYVLCRAMPRQQFAVVQSKIYPVYFRAMTYSIGIAFLGHVLAQRHRLFVSKPQMLQAYNLAASLFTLSLNSLYLEPRATKLMFERMKMEKEELTQEHPNPTATPGADQDALRSKIIRLNDKLKRLNSHSSFLNILNLMSLTWHLVYLAQSVRCPP